MNTNKQTAGLAVLRGTVLTLLLLLFVVWFTTQWVAYRYSYHPNLGMPGFHVGNHAIYQPFASLIWVPRLMDAGSASAKASGFIGSIILLAGSLVAVISGILFTRRLKRKTTLGSISHGSAHWASKDEVFATGLISPRLRGPKRWLTSGLLFSASVSAKPENFVYVGGWMYPDTKDIYYLMHDGPEHILVYAPTRSGKGISLVIPTLLAWEGSLLCYDIKGENYALTAGWRQSIGQKILRFEPTSTSHDRAYYNPLEEVRLGTDHEVADVQNIVSMIVDPEGDGLNDHWDKTGFAFLIGVTLHCLYVGRNQNVIVSLPHIGEFISNPQTDIDSALADMLMYEHDPTGAKGWKTHPRVAAAARDLTNMSINERSSVISTAKTFFALYGDPIVARHVSQSDFRIRDLMDADTPVSLYIVIPSSDKDRMRPLVRLLINQYIRTLVEKMDFEGGRGRSPHKHRLLMMIDEFPSLGKLEIFQESLAFLAGYGIKCYLITQDLNQLFDRYGKNEAIQANCHIRIAFAPNTLDTAEMLSKMSGISTISKTSRSWQGSGSLFKKVNTSEQEHQRPLMTADEIMRLPGLTKGQNDEVTDAGDMLVFVAGHPPIRGKQILYFKDPELAKRAAIPAPEKSDVTYGQATNNV